MKLNKIDFFAKGNLVIYQDYKIAINPVSGCREDIPCDPVEINSYEELSKRVAHHSDVELLVDDQLQNSEEMKEWRKVMPRKTPEAIALYQKSPNSVNYGDVTKAINETGAMLPEGQVLFHGGDLHDCILTRPLSTTFCPQVARQEASWKGKAKAAGSVNIYKITITGSEVTGYALKQKGTSHGNEKEVLISANHRLKVGNMFHEDVLADGLPIRFYEATIE